MPSRIMSYFNLKNRTIPQQFLIPFGVLGIICTSLSLFKNGLSAESKIMNLILFLGLIWTGTTTNKQKDKKKGSLHEDILDAD